MLFNSRDNRAKCTPTPTNGVGAIKCLQINLHHCQTAVQSFNEWMAESGHTTTTTGMNQKIGMICEPYIDKDSNLVKDFSNIQLLI